jgi:hypothetical protein
MAIAWSPFSAGAGALVNEPRKPVRRSECDCDPDGACRRGRAGPAGAPSHRPPSPSRRRAIPAAFAVRSARAAMPRARPHRAGARGRDGGGVALGRRRHPRLALPGPRLHRARALARGGDRFRECGAGGGAGAGPAPRRFLGRIGQLLARRERPGQGPPRLRHRARRGRADAPAPRSRRATSQGHAPISIGASPSSPPTPSPGISRPPWRAGRTT